MAQGKNSFRHESLQDVRGVQELLKAITRGIGRGRVTFSDDGNEIVLEPQGLVNLKVTARKDEGRHRLDLRVTWQVEEKLADGGALKVLD